MRSEEVQATGQASEQRAHPRRFHGGSDYRPAPEHHQRDVQVNEGDSEQVPPVPAPLRRVHAQDA